MIQEFTKQLTVDLMSCTMVFAVATAAADLLSADMATDPKKT